MTRILQINFGDNDFYFTFQQALSEIYPEMLKSFEKGDCHIFNLIYGNNDKLTNEKFVKRQIMACFWAALVTEHAKQNEPFPDFNIFGHVYERLRIKLIGKDEIGNPADDNAEVVYFDFDKRDIVE